MDTANDTFGIISQYLTYAAYIFGVIGIIIYLYHIVKLISIRHPKKKYDYITLHEIRTIWYGSLMLVIGFGLYPKSIVSDSFYLAGFVNFFISVAFATILGSIIFYPLKFYYPSFMNRRLKSLRYKPRISPNTGKPMKLMTESEEDVYLDEGMQAEEEVSSIDYDVWIDEDTGYTQIEKYQGKLTAKTCPNCGYQTFKTVKEEIIQYPDDSKTGQLVKKMHCGYCGHKGKLYFNVKKMVEEK